MSCCLRPRDHYIQERMRSVHCQAVSHIEMRRMQPVYSGMTLALCATRACRKVRRPFLASCRHAVAAVSAARCRVVSTRHGGLNPARWAGRRTRQRSRPARRAACQWRLGCRALTGAPMHLRTASLASRETAMSRQTAESAAFRAQGPRLRHPVYMAAEVRLVCAWPAHPTCLFKPFCRHEKPQCHGKPQDLRFLVHGCANCGRS